MTRENAVEWLNKRLAHNNRNQALNFDNYDLQIVRQYCFFYTNEMPSLDLVTASFRKTPSKQIIAYIDYMINKLVADFKIDVQVADANNIMSSFMGQPIGKTVLRYLFSV